MPGNQIASVNIGGRIVPAVAIAENLVRTTTAAANQQDSLGAVWMWVWQYQVPSGNVLAFKTRRHSRYAITMVLLDAATTAMPDATQVRLSVYYPDNERLKTFLLNLTYGTISNATKYDVDTMLTVQNDIDVQEDEWLKLEVLHATATLDISVSSIDIGCTRWVPYI